MTEAEMKVAGEEVQAALWASPDILRAIFLRSLRELLARWDELSDQTGGKPAAEMQAETEEWEAWRAEVRRLMAGSAEWDLEDMPPGVSEGLKQIMAEFAKESEEEGGAHE